MSETTLKKRLPHPNRVESGRRSHENRRRCKERAAKPMTVRSRIKPLPPVLDRIERIQLAFDFAHGADLKREMHFHQALCLYRAAGVKPNDIAFEFREAEVRDVIDWMEGRNPPRLAWRIKVLNLASKLLRRQERSIK